MGPVIIVTCAASISARPPNSPVIAPISREDRRFGIESDCDIGRASMEVAAIARLFQFDGLDDVAREEKFNHPVAQYANLALQARQFSQINTPPQEPGEKTAETHRFPTREGNRQF